ncbi:unnamed protein product [Rangifer tarandus platyrhynchus]|uniref:Uncharacterized protein n=2 Tax=Rangifer tarandus platyrhynchus TaxID=3082113 RepID=A0ABN9A0M7_RANTA|nr:unnamed protein product [Rangifer tarandus platyrhynchus]CAI9711549.1 unnamed protein product [Rangifer tarandus platyrhynchus]
MVQGTRNTGATERPGCLLKVTRRSGEARGAPALAAACAAAHPSARRAAPGRPGCRRLPPQSRLLNQRGEAPPPPTRLPGLSGPRLAAPPPAPSSSCSAIGCGSPPAFT